MAFLLLLTAFTSVSRSAAWYCEGRKCGVTLWQCCCVAEAASQDAQCGKPADDTVTTFACRTDCGCVMVFEASDGDTALFREAAPAPPAPVLAVLPAPIACYLPPILEESAETIIAPRGPPFRVLASAAAHGLRAPPVA